MVIVKLFFANNTACYIDKLDAQDSDLNVMTTEDNCNSFLAIFIPKFGSQRFVVVNVSLEVALAFCNPCRVVDSGCVQDSPAISKQQSLCQPTFNSRYLETRKQRAQIISLASEKKSYLMMRGGIPWPGEYVRSSTPSL